SSSSRSSEPRIVSPMNSHVTRKHLVASVRGSSSGSAGNSERGSALIMVLVGMTILGMFASVALTYSGQTLKVTRQTQDSLASLAAARAGVDEYLSRLNRDDYYWQKAPDCANIAMQKPTSGSNLCGWTAATPVGWAVVPGATDDNASYHYDVDSTATPTDGTIDLTVTGKAIKINRTIEVTLRRGGFGEFLYYTDYETIDPANEAIYGRDNATAFTKCAHYYWEPNTATSRPRDTSYCSDIKFSTGDVINGPTHSNDAIYMNGSPRFKGSVSTSWP